MDANQCALVWVGRNFLNLAFLLVGWLALDGIASDVVVYMSAFLALDSISYAPFYQRVGRVSGLNAFLSFCPLFIFAILLGFALSFASGVVFAALALLVFFVGAAAELALC